MALSDSEKKKAHRNRSGSVAEAISPDDRNDLDLTGSNLYIGTGGDLKVDTIDGQTITLKNIPSGTMMNWIKVKRIYSRGTTASDIVSIY
tara:strand:- start:451 stop:720 length:270 start_codon:yes stop_codon:yes gene_type:complete